MSVHRRLASFVSACLLACAATLVVATASPALADTGVTYSVAPEREVVDVNREFLLTRTPAGGTGLYDVHLERISTGVRVWLGQSSVGGPAALCDVASYVIFARSTASGPVIEVRNLVTGVRTALGPGSSPAAGSTTVAFVSNRDGDADIWTYDCTTNDTTKAVSAPGSQGSPALGTRYMAWLDERTGVSQVRLMRLGETTSSALTSDTAQKTALVITGNDEMVAWLVPRDEPNSTTWGYDRLEHNATAREWNQGGSQICAGYDRLGAVWEEWWPEGMNDSINRFQSDLRVTRPLSTLGDTAHYYTVGRGPYTFARRSALSGNTIYWSDTGHVPGASGPGYADTLRVASVTTNCILSVDSRTPARGVPIVLSATVRLKTGPVVAGALVAFDAWNGTRWSQVGGGRTYSHGMRQCVARPAGPTTYRARLISTTAAPSFSSKTTVTPR